MEVINPLIGVNEKLQNKILELALSTKKNFILKNYPIQKKGFSHVSKVPLKLLCIEYKKVGAFMLHKFVRDVLKIWYIHEVRLHEEVKKSLENNNYKIFEQTFNEDFQYRKLHDEDVNGDETESYYISSSEELKDFDPDEVTLMAFLLGWHPTAQNIIEEENSTEVIESTPNSFGYDSEKSKMEFELKELVKLNKSNTKAIKLLLDNSNNKEIPDSSILEKINEYSKTIQEKSGNIKNELISLCKKIKYGDVSKLAQIKNIEDLQKESLRIFEFINNANDSREILNSSESTLKLGTKIICLDNNDFVPVITCNNLCRELIIELEKKKVRPRKDEIALLHDKIKPVSDFNALVNDSQKRELKEERQNILLDSIKNAFGDVTREYFRGKLSFIEEVPPDNKSSKLKSKKKIGSPSLGKELSKIPKSKKV